MLHFFTILKVKPKNKVRNLETYTVKMSKKGQIAIPKKVRDMLNTDILKIAVIEDKVIITPSASIVTIGGTLKKYAEALDKQKISDKEDTNAWEAHVREKFGNH